MRPRILEGERGAGMPDRRQPQLSLSEALRLAWLATTQPIGAFAPQPHESRPASEGGAVDPEIFRREAARIGEQISALRFDDDGGTAWIRLMLGRHRLA